MQSTHNQKLSFADKKLLGRAAEISAGSFSEVGFVCRSMVSASMPHSKVAGTQYKRGYNNFTLTIMGNEEAGGIPYGTYPRLILCWLTSEIVKTQSREIFLGQSLSEFMNKLGLRVTGGRWGTISRFREQMKRLFSSHITFSYEDKNKGQWLNVNMNIADKTHIFWDPKQPNQLDLFKSKVFVGQEFYEEIKKTPVPINIAAINALKNSSLALDIYFWISYRLGYLSKPIEISFLSLQMQFGSGYKNTPKGLYEFKRKFLQQLKKVLVIYPEAKIGIKDTGILISPSAPHVSKSKIMHQGEVLSLPPEFQK